jgi:hypothetical protein
MKLTADCTTDETIFVPGGFTLDGQGHTITAVDPPAGAFLTAIVQNAGPVANVRNVVLTASGLANVCDPADPKLRAILFDGASGVIANNQIINVNKSGEGSCPAQGANVFLRKLVPSGPPAKVTVSGNTITGFSRFAVSVLGDVRATISSNTFEGLGGTGIAVDQQFAVAIQSGAVGTVARNTIIQSWATGLPFTNGIFVFESDGWSLTSNTISDPSFGIVIQSQCASRPTASGGDVTANDVRAHLTGITLQAEANAFSTCDPHVDTNQVKGNEVLTPPGVTGNFGIGVIALDNGGPFTPIASHNTVANNTIGGYATPILQFGDTNTLVRNNTVLP